MLKSVLSKYFQDVLSKMLRVLPDLTRLLSAIILTQD